MGDLLILILIATALIALCVAVVAGFILWRSYYGEHAERTKARLEALASKGSKRLAQSKSIRQFSRVNWLNAILKKHKIVLWLDKQLVRAGMSTQFDAAMIGWLLCLVVIGFFLSSVDASIYLWLTMISTTIVLPWLFVNRAIVKRRHLFEEQLPDVLDFISRAMQAGHAFSSALQVAASESPQPTAGEFSKTLNEINFGIPMDQALKDLSDRIDSPDMKFFSVAVLINREVGGDLAGLLDNLSSLIRARFAMRTSIRTLTAEGRFSAWLLSSMPFLVALVIFILRPDFLSPLWQDPLGLRLLEWAAALMFVGMLWMRRLANIHV